MIKKFTFLTTFLAFVSLCIAQDTISSGKKDTLIRQRAMIITFSPQMYMSDSDKEITIASRLDFKSLVNQFRLSLANSIEKSLIEQKYDPKILWVKSDNDTIDDLSLTYRSTGYKYEPLIVETKRTLTKTISGNSKTATVEPINETKIVNGQLVVKENTQASYMNTIIQNKKLLSYLSAKYGTDIFIFINQFEIKNDLSDYAAVGAHTNKRAINVHYTIFDKTEKRLCGYIASSDFPSTTNNIDDIIKKNFPPIADNIVSCLPNGKKLKESK